MDCSVNGNSLTFKRLILQTLALRICFTFSEARLQKFSLHFQKLGYKNLLVCHFDAMDSFHDKNGFVDSDEWLHYFLEYRHNKSISMISPGAHSPKLPQTSKLQPLFQYKHHIHHTRKPKHHVHNRSIHRKDKPNDRMR